jgi:hypothetical protein
MIKFLQTAPVKLLVFIYGFGFVGVIAFVQFLLGPQLNLSKAQGGWTIAILQLLLLVGVVGPRLWALGARNAIIITLAIILSCGGVTAYIFLVEIPANIEAAEQQAALQNQN